MMESGGQRWARAKSDTPCLLQASSTRDPTTSKLSFFLLGYDAIFLKTDS